MFHHLIIFSLHCFFRKFSIVVKSSYLSIHLSLNFLLCRLQFLNFFFPFFLFRGHWCCYLKIVRFLFKKLRWIGIWWMRAPNSKYIIQISSVLVFLFVARKLSCIHHRPVWLRICSWSYCNKRLFKFHELNECRTIIKKKVIWI